MNTKLAAAWSRLGFGHLDTLAEVPRSLSTGSVGRPWGRLYVHRGPGPAAHYNIPSHLGRHRKLMDNSHFKLILWLLLYHIITMTTDLAAEHEVLQCCSEKCWWMCIAIYTHIMLIMSPSSTFLGVERYQGPGKSDSRPSDEWPCLCRPSYHRWKTDRWESLPGWCFLGSIEWETDEIGWIEKQQMSGT